MKIITFFVFMFSCASQLNAMSENEKIDAARIAMKITARAVFAKKQEKENPANIETQKNAPPSKNQNDQSYWQPQNITKKSDTVYPWNPSDKE